LGAEKSSFNENFLAFQMQQRSIASKLENVVCEHCKHKIFSFVPEIFLFDKKYFDIIIDKIHDKGYY